QFNDIANPEWGASAYGRYLFTPSWGLDLGVSKEEFKGTPMNFDNINLLGFFRTAADAELSPIVGLGLGLTRIHEYSPKSVKLSLLGRLGAEYALMPSLGLGALVDYQYVSKIMGDMPTGRAHVLIPQLALTWYFGGESGKKEEMREEKKEAMVEKPKEQEPLVEEKVSVKEAATVRGERKPDLTIEFDTEKSNIKEHYMDQIKKVAEQLKQDYGMNSIIEGHADSTGPKAYNDKLSKRRAEAVKRKLIEYGIGEERIQTEGFGEDRPIADNRTKEGRQKNRRAAVYILIKTKGVM
ncbi:MAG: OmpA family protein, partial [Bacteriovorax sp.]